MRRTPPTLLLWAEYGGGRMPHPRRSGRRRAVRPSTGSWTATGHMNEAVTVTATLLRDGKVLVAGGGEDGNGTARLATAELYDPETGTGRPREDDPGPR